MLCLGGGGEREGGVGGPAKRSTKLSAAPRTLQVAVYGKVYDFTDFLAEHPGGVESITEFAGADGTETFDSIHSKAGPLPSPPLPPSTYAGATGKPCSRAGGDARLKSL